MAMIDVDEAVKRGLTVKFGKDVTVGPAEDPKNPVAKITEPFQFRKQERWDGTPPMTSDQKIPKVFPTNEDCGVKTPNGKCKEKIVAHRIMNQKYEKDTHGFGGQLQYLEEDVRYYKQCPIHGPTPPAPEFW